MANDHFSFTNFVNAGWSTSAWGALFRRLNALGASITSAFDKMPTDDELALLEDFQDITWSDGVFAVGDGTKPVGESGATARASMGVTIGSDVQAWSAVLDATTASFTTADETKLDFLNVTQAVDLDQMEADIAAQDEIVDTAGTQPAYTASPATAWTSYTDGASLLLKVHSTNSSGTATTLNVSGLGAKDVYIHYAAGVLQQVANSTMISGGIYRVVYNGTSGRFILQDSFASPLTLTQWGQLQTMPAGAFTTSGQWTQAGVFGGLAVTNGYIPQANGSTYTAVDLATAITAAGALMDSEVDANLKTLALPASTTISAFGATLVDDASASAARTTLGVDAAGTDNSTDVTLAGSYDYLSLSGQQITLGQIDLSTDVTGALPASAGAVLDSELTSIADVKALNQGVATTDSPAFAGLTVDTDTLYVDTTNNRIGVGTTSPGRSLHLEGTSSGIRIDYGGGVYCEFLTNANGDFLFYADPGNSGAGTDFQWHSDGSERMRLGSTYLRPASNNAVDLGQSALAWKDGYFGGVVKIDGTQVLGNRQTGWGAPTGTATRTTFATSTVTTEQLAERLHALIDDLTTHGIIGS